MKQKIRLISSVLLISFAFPACERETQNPEPSDPRNLYTGTWTCEENSGFFGNSTYEVDIYKHSTEENKIVIDNFYNLGYDKNAQALVSGNSISIPSQKVGDYTVQGSGLLENGVIDMEYTTDDGSGKDDVKATYRKK